MGKSDEITATDVYDARNDETSEIHRNFKFSAREIDYSSMSASAASFTGFVHRGLAGMVAHRRARK